MNELNHFKILLAPDMEQCEQLTVPILVLLLPTSVFLALAGSLVCWMKTRDTASEKSGDQENVFTILGIKRKLIWIPVQRRVDVFVSTEWILFGKCEINVIEAHFIVNLRTNA